MLFPILLLLDCGIIFLYAAYKNVSPFEVIQSFVAPKKDSEEDTENEQ